MPNQEANTLPATRSTAADSPRAWNGPPPGSRPNLRPRRTLLSRGLDPLSPDLDAVAVSSSVRDKAFSRLGCHHSSCSLRGFSHRGNWAGWCWPISSYQGRENGADDGRMGRPATVHYSRGTGAPCYIVKARCGHANTPLGTVNLGDMEARGGLIAASCIRNSWATTAIKALQQSPCKRAAYVGAAGFRIILSSRHRWQRVTLAIGILVNHVRRMRCCTCRHLSLPQTLLLPFCRASRIHRLTVL